jgi:Na+/H+ antiporter NhaD/arsenite permease-like protein
MPIPIIILLAVLVAIAIRQIGKFRFQIWQIMLAGAAAVLITRQISIKDALNAINYDVMIFLFGMFVLGLALEKSGLLTNLSNRLFGKTKSVNVLIFQIIIGAGIVSAVLMNDTVAIIGAPIMLYLANRYKLNPKLLLLALAFAITLGSVFSPIGNPQNLLIALNGNFANPFTTFFEYLFVPTIINLLIAWLFLRFTYSDCFVKVSITPLIEQNHDRKLARLSSFSLALMIAMIFAKIILALFGMETEIKLTYIAIMAALPIILFSPRRFELIKGLDWSTLVFFAAMFILMDSVWRIGFFQNVIVANKLDLNSNLGILIFSVVSSQFISNVPLVALYLPAIIQSHGSVIQLMALASGSTIAGNFMILGAASNIIIIQNAENRSTQTLTFLDFAKIGIPLTAINLLVYWLYFKLIPLL